MSYMRRATPQRVLEGFTAAQTVKYHSASRSRGAAGSLLTTPVSSLIPPAPRWHLESKCAIEGKDPDFFYPGRGIDTSIITAYCEDCPVRTECLEENLLEEIGFWGGVSARGRERIAYERGFPVRMRNQTPSKRNTDD